MRWIALSLLLAGCPKKNDTPVQAPAEQNEERPPWTKSSLPGAGGDWQYLDIERGFEADIGRNDNPFYVTFDFQPAELSCAARLQEHMTQVGWTHRRTDFDAEDGKFLVVMFAGDGEELWDLTCGELGGLVQGTANWWRTRPFDPWDSMDLPNPKRTRCRTDDCAFVYEEDAAKIDAIWAAALVKAGWNESEEKRENEKLWVKGGQTMLLTWTSRNNRTHLRAILR